MKKALLFFLGVVFVCCIYAYGTNERFSVEKWLENVKQISETATIEDLTSCWTENSYRRDFSHCPNFVEGYIKNADGTLSPSGRLRLAYEFHQVDGGVSPGAKITKRYSYDTVALYYANGEPRVNLYSSIYGDNLFPVITDAEVVFYEAYDGDNDVLEWLDTMVGFFKRLGRTIKLFADMVLHVFRNMRLLLPWNATVPIT